MIDRFVVQITDSNKVLEELDYLGKHYSYKTASVDANPRELVFQTYTNRVILYHRWSNSYEVWNTSVCLPSFQDIPKLHLLQSIGLSDKEIQEYFPWRSAE